MCNKRAERTGLRVQGPPVGLFHVPVVDVHYYINFRCPISFVLTELYTYRAR